MTATDLQGQKWNSEKIIFHNNQIPTDYSLGKAIKVRVPYISRNGFNPNILPNVAEDKNICKNYSTFIIRGQLELPYNSFSKEIKPRLLDSIAHYTKLTPKNIFYIVLDILDMLRTRIFLIHDSFLKHGDIKPFTKNNTPKKLL